MYIIPSRILTSIRPGVRRLKLPFLMSSALKIYSSANSRHELVGSAPLTCSMMVSMYFCPFIFGSTVLSLKLSTKMSKRKIKNKFKIELSIYLISWTRNPFKLRYYAANCDLLYKEYRSVLSFI